MSEDKAGRDDTSDHDGDDESEDSEDSEDLEPKLKYSRMKNDLQSIFLTSSVSCCAVHPKFIFLGTKLGFIHMLDLQGNHIYKVGESGLHSKDLQAHSLNVNEISIDSNGDFLASCSDGNVFVNGLYSSDNNVQIAVKRRVRTIAIDPFYYKSNSGRRFIAGDDNLVLYEKTFLVGLKSTILSKAEGAVHSIKWKGQFVAWADYIGVRIYDINARCSLGLMKWPRNPEALPENYRCNLCWKDNTTLLVGWVDSVRIFNIRRRSPQELTKGRDASEYVVQLESKFETDFYICGIGPLDKTLVILGFSKELQEDGKSERPILSVVEPLPDYYVELSSNALTLEQYETLKCNDYHLECLVEENIFFIVSPKDVVIANPCDADDHIQWLMEHKKYKEALEAVIEDKGFHIKKHSLMNVGNAYLDHLLFCEKYQEAGLLCQKILGNDKRLWEEEVFKFAQIHQLRAVSEYLPVGEHKLDKFIYEMVLYEFLKMDPEGFRELVKKWPPHLYNLPPVINALLEHLMGNEADKGVLLESLAILYSHEYKYDKALALYLKLRHKDVFQLIATHKLYYVVHDMIEGLIELDAARAIAMFVDKRVEIPPDVVIKRLASKPYYQYLYLDALDRTDSKISGRKYHGVLVKLYADYDFKKLLPLLRRSDNYPIQEALSICKERKYNNEMVYLLGRMGKYKEALNLIIQELRDIEQAIAFCKEKDDMELWEDLINYSLKHPDFITFLLQHIGTYIDPRILIQKLDNTQEIPGLKLSLVKMMRDYSLQVSVQEGYKKILVSDYFNLHDRLVKMQQRGVSIDDNQLCGKCERKIVRKVNHMSNVAVFYCKHIFHEDCLRAPDSSLGCMICNSQKPSVY